MNNNAGAGGCYNWINRGACDKNGCTYTHLAKDKGPHKECEMWYRTGQCMERESCLKKHELKHQGMGFGKRTDGMGRGAMDGQNVAGDEGNESKAKNEGPDNEEAQKEARRQKEAEDKAKEQKAKERAAKKALNATRRLKLQKQMEENQKVLAQMEEDGSGDDHKDEPMDWPTDELDNEQDGSQAGDRRV